MGILHHQLIKRICTESLITDVWTAEGVLALTFSCAYLQERKRRRLRNASVSSLGLQFSVTERVSDPAILAAGDTLDPRLGTQEAV